MKHALYMDVTIIFITIKYMEVNMEIIIRGLIFLGVAFMFAKMMKGGGCCGQSHGNDNANQDAKENVKSCCSTKK